MATAHRGLANDGDLQTSYIYLCLTLYMSSIALFYALNYYILISNFKFKATINKANSAKLRIII